MIGMVSVQCDSPLDFYATPKRRPSKKLKMPTGKSTDSSTMDRTPSVKNLFKRREADSVSYTADGRKMSNGHVIEQQSPNKLWEELIVRTFAQRIEHEIRCPVQGYKTLEEGMQQMKGLDRTQSCSTYSLVSEHRVEAERGEVDRDIGSGIIRNHGHGLPVSPTSPSTAAPHFANQTSTSKRSQTKASTKSCS